MESNKTVLGVAAGLELTVPAPIYLPGSLGKSNKSSIVAIEDAMSPIRFGKNCIECVKGPAEPVSEESPATLGQSLTLLLNCT